MSFEISPRFDFGRGFARISKNLRSFLVTLSSAFDASTGHSHGASGHGAPIIAAGIATTPGLFDTPTATVVQDHVDGAKELLAANSAGDGDRLVLVQATVTEAFDTTSWELQAGSASDPNGLFADIFAGVADLALGENVVGIYQLPEAEALATVETSMVDDLAGKISFAIVVITLNATAGNIEALAVDTAELAAGAATDVKIDSKIVKDPGRIACGLVDFNATGDCTSVDVGPTAVYTRHDDTPDLPNGVWEDGASGTESATNLAAAINGDTRNSGGPYYAAIADGTTCWIMALVVGTAGNVTVTKTGGTDPDVQENLTEGAAAVVKQVACIDHTVTAEEATQVELFIPLPFDPTSATVTVRGSTGVLNSISDLVTLVAAASPVPAHIKIVTAGATHIASGDIVSVVAIE